MVMSTKDNSSPVLLLGYCKWMILLFGLLWSFQKCAAYDVSTSCPSPLMDNTNVILSCFVNKTYINAASCGTRPSVLFSFTSSSTGSSNLCTSSYPNGSCGTLPTGSIPCGCTNESGDLYTFQYNFTAIQASHENGSITCGVVCFPLSITYFHEVNCSSLAFVTHPTTTAATSSSESTTKAPNCTDNCPQRSKCPDWCIAVSVCVPVGGGLIITITVIIIKKKKAKTQGSSVQDTKEMQDRTKHHGTENRPTPAQGGNNRTEERPTPAQSGNNRTEERPTPAQSGNNRTEESVQDTKEMQYKTKHLGTENSAYL